MQKKSYVRRIAFLLFYCFLFITSAIDAQDLLWKANLTGAGDGYPGKAINDGDDNIYVIGNFSGSLNFNGTVNSMGGTDGFIAKYSSAGALLWVKQIGGLATENITGITISNDNEFIYVTGTFNGTAYADNLSISTSGGIDAFLAKYDKNGTIIWLKRIVYGSTSANQRIMDIKNDLNNNLVIVGQFFTDVYLGNTSNNIYFSTSYTVGQFVSKFDTSGNVINAKKIECTISPSLLYSVGLDTSGYYLCGNYKGNLIIDLPQKTALGADIFIYKVDNNLNGRWLLTIGGSGDEQLSSCSVDGKGNLYVGGHFASPSITVDSTSTGIVSKKIGYNTTTDGKYDVFFAKYSSSGVLQWFNTAGSTGNDYLYRAAYKNGNFIAAGQYGGDFTFNSQTITSKGNGDAFAIIRNSFNTTGSLISVSGAGAEVGETAAIDNDGNYIVVGDYTSPRIYFGNNTDSLDNSNSGTRDMFVAKYERAKITKVITPASCAGAFNGAVNITPTGILTPPLQYTWTKKNDTSFTANTQNITGLSVGTYTVTLTDATGYTKTDSAIITAPPAMTLTASVTNVTCENGANDGKIALNNPVNGKAPFTYQWDNGSYTQEITSLGIGYYSVTVTDSLGCKAMFSASVGYGSPIAGNISVTNIDPPGQLTGSIEPGITGGYPPYNYQWSNGATSAVISGLTEGRYYVTVTDSKQCKKNFDARVNDLTLNAYLPTGQVPDADARILDASLNVGSVPGNANVTPSGAASYTLPVEVPPGIAGMEPKIVVSYNSQSGNSLAGWGWNVGGLSSVTRTASNIYSDGTAKGVQLTGSDPFVMDGNRLVVINGTNGADNSEYVTERETFARIIAHGNYGNTGPEWFEVTAKNGMKFKYGLSQGSKLIYNDNNGTDSTKAIIAWYLDSAEDRYGNFISYTYEQEGLTTYLKKITYGNNLDAETHNNNTVEFNYAKRNDPIPVHYGRLKGTADLLLYSIVTRNNGSVFRSYQFEYTSDVYTRLVKVTESTGNGSKLNPTVIKWGNYNTGPVINDSISVDTSPYKNFADQYYISADVNGDGLDDLIGFSPYDYSCGPGCTSNTNIAQVYTASRAADGSCHFTPSGMPYDLGASINLDFKSYITGNTSGDIDGDGKKEIIVSRYSYMDYIGPQVYFNILKNGGQQQIGRNLKASSEIPVYAIGDLNNDGIDELVFIEKGTGDNLNYPGELALFGKNKWIPFNVHQKQSVVVKMPIGGTLTIPIKPEKMFIADFDGDGMQDIIVLDKTGYTIYKNNGVGDSISFERETSGTDFNSNYHIQLGDFNGDGLPDFILSKKGTDTGEWYLALNNGGMGFSMISLPGITARDDKDTDKDDDKDNIIVTDFNNDGKSDAIIVDATYDNWDHAWGTSWKTFTGLNVYWYKSTGEALELVKKASSGNESDAYQQYFITGDFNGDGRTDLINYGFDCYGAANMDRKWRLYDVPDSTYNDGLVTTIANGFNVKTKFSYKPLTDGSVYSNSFSAAYPVANITEPLYVVNRSTTDGGMAGLTTINYTYKDGIIHKQGLGFLGFGKTTQTNTKTNVSTAAELEFDPTYFNISKQTTEAFLNNSNISEAISEFASEPLGGKRVFVHPSATKTTDLLKNITISTVDTFDNNGNLTSQRTSYNSDFYITEKLFSSFDSLGNPGAITSKMTRKGEPVFTQDQSYIYNSKGKPLTATANGLTGSYTYDRYGNPLTVTLSADGLETRKDSSKYDTTGRFVEKHVNALGHVTENTYDNLGQLLRKKDANGLTITNKYDVWGKLIEATAPDGKKTTDQKKWVTLGDPVAPDSSLYYTETYSDGKFSGAEYFDRAGNSLRKVTTGFNGVKYYTDYTYNAKGEISEVTEPYAAGEVASKRTSYTYDDYGRVLTETLPDGVKRSYTYTDAENKVEVAYSTGEKYTKISDVTGLASQATDPGGTIRYFYTSTGKPRRIESPGSIVEMTYDADNRQHTLTDPNSGIVVYDYNTFGELISQTNARGKDTMQYDKLGRMISKVSGGISTTYTYDAPGAVGLVKSIDCTGKAGAMYTYDQMGRIIEETRNKGAESFTCKYTYDSLGRVSKMRYPAGFAVKYNYNANNDLTEIRDTSDNLIWKIDSVNNKGQLLLATYGNKKQLTYGYDSNDRLNHISVPGIIDFNYQFNDKQQLDYRDEKYWIGDSLKGFREDFSYDGVNRLSTASVTGAQTLSVVYNTVANDRISSKSDIGIYKYQDGNHRIDEIDSLQGYLPADDSIAYTPEGKVSTIIEGKKILTYIYDVNNQRFSASYNDSITGYTRYYFNGYEKELNNDGSLRRHLNYIFAGNTLVAIYEQKATGDSMHYVYTDYLGSLRCITNAGGKVEQRLSFDAWGNRRDPVTGVRFSSSGAGGDTLLFARGFTGHEHLDEFGLINMNGRVYDPALGVFLSPDNYVQAPNYTQNFNRYAYCFHNPLMYTDPDGQWAVFDDLAVMGIGGIFNLASNLIQGNVHSWGQAAGYFVTGMAAGEATYYGGPVAGAAVLGLGNNLTQQISAHGWSNINWGQAAVATGAGALSGYFGAALNNAVSPVIVKALSKVGNQVVLKAMQQGLANGISGFGVGTGMSLLSGNDMKTALKDGAKGAVFGLGLGLISGTIEGYQQLKADKAAEREAEDVAAGSDAEMGQDAPYQTPNEKGQEGQVKAMNDMKTEFNAQIINETPEYYRVNNRGGYTDFTVKVDNNGNAEIWIVEVKNGPSAALNTNQKFNYSEINNGMIPIINGPTSPFYTNNPVTIRVIVIHYNGPLRAIYSPFSF